ncbi:MAG: SEC-C domain-containing protein [Thauera sp.]|nr:SEC-C domain-containing protein [Thauera sp.]
MVLRYHNEIVATIALGEEGWDPFCYSPEGKDAPPLGEEWIAGFEQGLESWPEDWRERFSDDDVDVAEGLLERAFAPWASEEEDLDVRLGWLAESAQAVRGLHAHWRELGVATPVPVSIDAPGTSQSGGPGRNDPCPCGSGKKYKKCCGAPV